MKLQDKVLRNTATMNERVKWETRKRKVNFWGSEIEIEPVLCSTIFGNGKQLVYIGTTDQRPNYWLLKIDSSTDVSDDDFDFEDLLMALEEEFGRHPDCLVDEDDFVDYKSQKKLGYEDLNNYDTFEDYIYACQYPAIWWGGGHWGSLGIFDTHE